MVNISPRKRVAKAQLQTDRDQKEHEIQEALSAFQKGQFKDLKAAAEHHNAIPPEAKELLVRHIQKQANYGFPVTPQNLRQLAKQLLRQRTNNNYATLGPNWVSAFKQRHPELRSYYSHKMDAARVQATSDPSVVEAYFDVLEKTIAKYMILPKNIFNMNKTGFLIGQSQCQYIIVPRENGKNQCFRSQPGNQETITVIECIGAQGTKPPPMVIFWGKNHMQGVIGLSTQGRSTGTKAWKKTTIAGLGMVEQEARGLAGTSSRHGQSATSMESAASMETMDMEDRAVCMVAQAPPQGGPSSRSIQMVPTQGLERQESKEPSLVKEKEQCIGNRQVGPEEEEQCRQSRHSSGGQEWC
ncbi:uncharacterized protein UHOD_11186 [Ustilago sp. UG-2017b]|nr:uncharacterized protein UHOD_11186 [Ustilago sp. UG-2017b]